LFLLNALNDVLTIRKVEAIALQPLDAAIQAYGYFLLPYPFILGSSVAGKVFAVGSSVTRFVPGDRVVCDTGAYVYKEIKYSGWQKYAVSKEAFNSEIESKTSFEDAVAVPFALLTAIGALSFTLGMPKPGEGGKGRVLIWGASGSVGGYAVQYASRVCAFTLIIHCSQPY
jgi:NADPH:quinone reductase-like Zn-dependent oxidoreductase